MQLASHKSAAALFVVATLFLIGGCSSLLPSDRAAVVFRGAHEFGSTAVAFDPSATHLFSGGHQGNIKLWDIQKRKLLSEVRLHEGAIRAIAVVDQSFFATAADDGQIVVSNHGKMLSQTTPTLVSSLVWYGDKLVSGHDDGFLRIWNKSLEPVLEFKLNGKVEGITAHGRELAVALPDRILVMGPDYDVKKVLDAGGATPHDIQFSPDGKRLAAGGWFRLHIWELDSGNHQSLPTEHGGLLTSVSFSPDGKHLVSLGRHTDSAIRIVDTGEFNVTRRYQAHELCGAMIRYSPDGRWLASASDDESIRLYDLSLPYQPR